MKSSFGKLRRFALHKNDSKEKRNSQALSQVDELAQASQDMQEMRECYDSLLSAAAATTNSAYEFSESLKEMGSCLLERTTINDDKESGKVLFMLGKAQLEIQKLVDCYRSHIILTITNPSESLLNELRTVEEMKRQCDEKRKVYDYMLAQQREKGKSKSGKAESFTSQQLKTAHDEYDEEATLCVFRLKSLKQGQSRSLLTQAARHHAAQLIFFRKGLKSLDAVDPHVRTITEKQHIDYLFSGLEDDVGEDGEDESEDSYDASNDIGELSFDYRQNKHGSDIVFKSRNSVEFDPMDVSYHQASTTESTEVKLGKHRVDPTISKQEPRGSFSAPILAEKKFDPSDIKQTQPFTRKLHTYILPTPVNSNTNPVPPRSSTSTQRPRPTTNPWHSSPLEPPKHENETQTVKNTIVGLGLLPPPLTEGFSPLLLDSLDGKKIKRQAFSGPLASKPSTKPVGPIASPPRGSSPNISELHQLPRPPLPMKSPKYPYTIGHSAPLISKNQEIFGTNKGHFRASNTASPLPIPPLTVPRSFSSPSSSRRAMGLHMAKVLDSSSKIQEKGENVASPPLTPISLPRIIMPLSSISQGLSQSDQI